MALSHPNMLLMKVFEAQLVLDFKIMIILMYKINIPLKNMSSLLKFFYRLQ